MFPLLLSVDLMKQEDPSSKRRPIEGSMDELIEVLSKDIQSQRKGKSHGPQSHKNGVPSRRGKGK